MKLLLVQLMRCGYPFEHCCLREFRPQESTFGKCSAIAWAGFTWAFVLSFIFYHLVGRVLCCDCNDCTTWNDFVHGEWT